MHDCGDGRVFWGDWEIATETKATNKFVAGAILYMASPSRVTKNEARLRRMAAVVFLDPIEEKTGHSCFDTNLRPGATDEQHATEDAVRRAKFIASEGRGVISLVFRHGDGGKLAAATIAAYFVLECGTSPSMAVEYFKNERIPASGSVPDEAFLITIQNRRHLGRRKTITTILGEKEDHRRGRTALPKKKDRPFLMK